MCDRSRTVPRYPLQSGRAAPERGLSMMKAHLYAIASCTLLLYLLLPFSQAQNDDQVAALLSLKDAVGATNVNLSSWNTSSIGGPCDDRWAGITCDFYKKIIGLNTSAFGLVGTLPVDIFSKLTSLKSLDMSRNNLTSPFPSVDHLTSINDMNFTSNAFRETFPTSVLACTSLVELRLDNNFFSGLIPEQISNLQLLEQLWLGNNVLSGPLPQGLVSLTHLQTLTVWGSILNQALPPQWAVWVNLTYLNLHNSGLMGKLPPEWGQNFTKLQRLQLYNNRLEGPLPDSWKGMTSLMELKCKNNDLTGEPPAWLTQLEKRNATVDFVCNYFMGPPPETFNQDTWKGNCFDPDQRAHDVKCDISGESATCKAVAFGQGKGKSSFPSAAIAGIVVGVIVLLLVIVLLVCWARLGSSKSKRRKREDAGDWEVPQGVRRFTYKEISKATASFDKSCEIGEGGFGKVYVAQLPHGKQVAIKRASDLSFQGTKEFQNEITLLSRLHHRHLVRLEGFCDDKDEQILVYEYMKNGNLHHHLLGEEATTLNWYRRLEIALAVAQGLDYLHSFADPPVIHRDVKPSNILLDENMVAKVSDFGISKANPEMDTHVSTRPAGTAGYLDPEYFLRRQLTTASDVYGYGVVLLELITGQLAIDHKRLEEYNIVAWAKSRLVRKGIHSIIDQRLGPNFPADTYEEVAEIAVSCTAFEKADRPSMQIVASKLEYILSGLIPPPEHLMPVSSPTMLSLPKGKTSSSQFSASRTDPLSDVKIQFGFEDTAVQPR